MAVSKILVATDLCALSSSALEKAVSIAKQSKAEIILLHVLEKGGGFFDLLPNQVLPPVRKYLIKTREQIANRLDLEIKRYQKSGVNIRYAIVKGQDVSTVITNYVKKHNIQLLLIGAHGKYTFYNYFVGTTAERLAEKISCPLLIVKNRKKSSYKNILLPVDFSKASKAAVMFGNEFFPESHFQAIYVADEVYNQFLYKGQLRSYMKTQQIKKEILQLLMAKIKNFMQAMINNQKRISFKILIGYPGIEILKEAKKKSYSLIIMGTQGHNKRHYAWLGRVANRVLMEIDKDLLLVPPPKIKLKKSQSKDGYIEKVSAATNAYLDELKILAKNKV